MLFHSAFNHRSLRANGASCPGSDFHPEIHAFCNRHVAGFRARYLQIMAFPTKVSKSGKSSFSLGFLQWVSTIHHFRVKFQQSQCRDGQAARPGRAQDSNNRIQLAGSNEITVNEGMARRLRIQT